MYKSKHCRVCGQLFIPSSSRQMDCNRTIKRSCVICGNEFEARCSQNDKRQTCSAECSKKYAHEQSIESWKSTTRTCEWCGKEFTPKNNTQKYCDSAHYGTCVVCGAKFVVDLTVNKSDIRQTCSDECLNKLKGGHLNAEESRKSQKATMLSRYGVEYAAQAEQFKQKQRETTKQRYGTEHFVQSEYYRERAVATNLSKYGTEWGMQCDEVKQKSVQTSLSRYGTSSPMQNEQVKKMYGDKLEAATGYRSNFANPAIQERIKATNLKKYGVEFYPQSAEFTEAFKKTSQERFGTDNPMQNDAVKSKVVQTVLERYGARNYLASEEGKKHAHERMVARYGEQSFSRTKEWKERVLRYCTNLDEWMLFTHDPEQYVATHFSSSPTYRELSLQLGVMTSTVCDFLYSRGLKTLCKQSLSYMETEVSTFLQSISAIKIVPHNRRLIHPYELDIWLPEYNVGIECNPTATHNSSFSFMDVGDNITPVKYHQMKTDMCEAKGIFLFHIFGYEWSHRRPIIESMLRNIVGKNTDKVYARECEVREVSGGDAHVFLDANHRQGSVNSPIRLGLYHDGELVSLMTFGKMRNTIGTDTTNLDDCYELVRFCNKLNTSVVGGASKLFAHFTREYKPHRVRSFSDRAHTRGTLYQNLGFTEIRRSEPGYVWVDTASDIAYNRVNAQKRNIMKFLDDPEIDLAQTEKQIMEAHRFAQVFDSGTITWEWRDEAK